MKITVYSPTTPPRISVIADDDDNKYISGYRETPTREKDVMKFTRAEEAETADRGNELTAISFSVELEFDTIQECVMAMLSHRREVEPAGRVEFEESSDGGYAMLFLSKCIVEITEITWLGCSYQVGYSITGGKMKSRTTD